MATPIKARAFMSEPKLLATDITVIGNKWDSASDDAYAREQGICGQPDCDLRLV